MKRKTMTVSLLWILMGVFLLACSKQPISNPKSSPAKAAVTTSAPTPTDTPLPTETPMKEDTESLKNKTGKTIFKSFTTTKSGDFHATVAIVSEKGTVAIADPHAIPMDQGLVKADIITISHGHPDHNDYNFLGKSNAQKSIEKTESFTIKEMKVYGIAASHTKDFDINYPSDIIYVFEVDGLRIAHFGDMGEDQLTEDQLKQLGKIDILFTRFSNIETYGASTEKTIALIKQVKPSIVLPLHYEPEVVDEILKKLNITDRSETDTLAVNKKDLEGIKGTKYVLLK